MVKETCSCGASIETDEVEATARIVEWRAKHKHGFGISPRPLPADVGDPFTRRYQEPVCRGCGQRVVGLHACPGYPRPRTVMGAMA